MNFFGGPTGSIVSRALRSAPPAAVALIGLALAFAACGEDKTGSQGGEDALADTLDAIVSFDTLPSGADTASPNDTAASADVEEGEFGAPCNANGDCHSSWCVEGPEGFICTKECQEQCPAGYDCKGVASQTDVVFLCLPRLSKLCAPCLDDLQCNGGACLELDGRKSCAAPCGTEGACPTGYHCGDDAAGAAPGAWCVPDTGSCTCSAEADGGLRTCARDNAIGRCFGVQECDPLVGWSACSAREPAREVCDGEDNDCNGRVDDELDDIGGACEVAVPGVGACQGVTRCGGVEGVVCQAPTPEPEVCDFQDNDCDGQTDEDFKTDGQYASFEHCGTCNRSCATGFPGAQLTQCQVGGAIPQCVVVTCQPGYVKLNEFQCIPDVVNLCEACSSDDQCIGADSYCNTLTDGTYCGKGCVGGGDCPAGFSCQSVGRATKQCIPTTGVCSCSPATQGLSRACTASVSPAGQPSYTCAGTQTCGAGGWAACALPAEQCDGFDNNCDGRIDEDFRDAQGRYNRVENCGGCGISCLALTFQNASPICDTSGGGAPQCGFQCQAPWVDVDGLPGCECAPSSSTDLPDPLGIDANCDGIDGELDNGIFVAKTGNDSAAGIIDDPLRTVQAGIDRAAASGKRDVYVATGVYVESVLLKDGVTVYGGYSPDFHARDIDVHESAIIGAAPTAARRGAVNADGVGSNASKPLGLDGFTIFGANNAAPAGNSYAVYLRNVGPNLTIARNLIYAGDAGAGTSGSDGADGAGGTNGAAGGIARNVGTTCTSSEHRPGGAGGSRTCGGTSTSGGKGGNAVCPNAPNQVQTGSQTPTSQEYGGAGGNNGPSTGRPTSPGWHALVGFSSCGICSSSNSHPSDGGRGGDGGAGPDGGGAGACSNGDGRVVASQWVANDNGGGGSGTAGGGGAGGSAAGGVDHTSACSSVNLTVGGSGGGGGAGGCAGLGGAGGVAGGGSFGVFLTWTSAPSSLPTVRDNVVYRGRGGSGGSGGSGGIGGSGGFGAPGGLSGQGTGSFPMNYCGSAGGAGGNGGRGGHGAGGAGGCGGVAYGTYLDPIAGAASKAPIATNTYPSSGAGGTGGTGGRSYGVDGPAGATGSTGAKNF